MDLTITGNGSRRKSVDQMTERERLLDSLNYYTRLLKDAVKKCSNCEVKLSVRTFNYMPGGRIDTRRELQKGINRGNLENRLTELSTEIINYKSKIKEIEKQLINLK